MRKTDLTQHFQLAESDAPVVSPDEDTLAKRVQKAMKHYGFTGLYIEEAADLPSGYSTRILKGERKWLQEKTLRRLSNALRVNYDWLTTGEGEMLSPSPAPPLQTGKDPYPSRPAVLRFAREAGYPEEAIEFVASQSLQSNVPGKDEDLGVDYWLDQLRSATQRVRAGMSPGLVGVQPGWELEEKMRAKLPPSPPTKSTEVKSEVRTRKDLGVPEKKSTRKGRK
jgi:transcriptional regulator with XRE-family HTH domain